MTAEKTGLPGKKKGWHITITMRVTLLGWAVAIMSLLFFMAITVPRQEKLFVNTLASKANGLSASLYDAAAAAAVNEDYSSVVNEAQILMKQDPGIEFLIIIKNDGFALVIEQEKWQVDQLTDPHFLRKERKPAWEIEISPLLLHRLFHFAKPFDYSGIQWGWIHVGLSVNEYDQSVTDMYKNTGYVALICIVISLFGSLFYAQQIVRPILKLKGVVRKIAAGDLSIRADMHRKDEFGSLAASVNTMADTLLKRNRILESVRFAAYHFLQEQSWEENIIPVLEQVGMAADISRVLIHHVSPDKSGLICASKLFEWNAPGISPEREDPEHTQLCFEYRGVGHWADAFSAKHVLSRSADDCSDAEKIIFQYQEMQSFIAVPVFVENRWWGIVTLEDCVQKRKWTGAETSSFMALADMLGATIARQRFQTALIEAKNNLEEKVALRTKELQDQVREKEQAMAELSSAQSSLVEMSRSAGMAEVATGVLHNVGNVLNSINVSSTLIMDILKESRTGNVSKVAEMMTLPPGALADFLAQDEKGRRIPAYLTSLGKALSEEHSQLFEEANALAGRIEHIKEIVAMQQSYGRVSGLSETIPPEQLMEDALMLNERALIRHEVIVKKTYEKTPPVTVDKHKVLQILLNLINNAKYACSESGKKEKAVTLKIFSKNRNAVCLSVSDNGIGIPAENLTRIFQHGFTTRKSGHGFGLHSGALAARELGGRLYAASDGTGKGAVFTLELPVKKQEAI